MKAAAPIAVAFREVRHFGPDDCLHCEPIEVRGRLHDWTIPAHRHEGLHQFQYLQRGGARVTFDSVPYAVQAPAVLLIAPGCVHSLQYEPGSAGLQVTVPTAVLQQLFTGATSLAARLTASRVLDGSGLYGEASRAGEHFAALAAEFEQAAPGRMEALQAHVVLLVTWLLRRVEGNGGDDARSALRDTLVRRYRALLELHLRQHQRLGFYADALKVTPDHLSRVCRAVTGQPALDLLQERMLLEARRLLAYTDAPVVAIAHELGFSDPAYFSRFFSRRGGGSPLAYRSSLQWGTAIHP